MPRLPLDNLCAELEAPMPSAAGGSAAAACAAMAASLVVMVGQGSPEWVEAEAAAAAAEELRDQLLVLGGDDIEAVAALLAAIGGEGAGDDGVELQEARLRAAAVPLAIAESAAEVTTLAREAAKHGRRSMRPDAAAAASIAATAARVARSIVALNLAQFPAGEQPPEIERMRAAARAVSERIGGS
jgi:formiminotetrahydrofolate cyclodeaminase